MQPQPARQENKLIFLALIGIAIVVVIYFFGKLPLEGTNFGVDWRVFYEGSKNGIPNYDRVGGGFYNPPWVLPFLLPLGFLSFSASWGLICLFTMGVLIASVPAMRNRALWMIAIFLLITSRPAMRHFADGNLEGFCIAGLLIILYSFPKQDARLMAVGIILATIKPQETWLLVGILGVLLLLNWPVSKWRMVALSVLVVVGLTMLWQGLPWLKALRDNPANSQVDISLLATLRALGLEQWYIVLWVAILIPTFYLAFLDRRSLNTHKVGLLVAASMLLAPYSSGISLVTIVALGAIPLFATNPILALGLIIVANIPYLPLPEWVDYGRPYSTLVAFSVWGAMCWTVYRDVKLRTHLESPQPKPLSHQR